MRVRINIIVLMALILSQGCRKENMVNSVDDLIVEMETLNEGLNRRDHFKTGESINFRLKIQNPSTSEIAWTFEGLTCQNIVYGFKVFSESNVFVGDICPDTLNCLGMLVIESLAPGRSLTATGNWYDKQQSASGTVTVNDDLKPGKYELRFSCTLHNVPAQDDQVELQGQERKIDLRKMIFID